MGTCDFTYQLKVTPEELIQEITKLVAEFKGEFQGDAQAGNFSLEIMMSRVAGKYQIDGEKVQIHITEKPFMIGWETISQTIKAYLPGLA